MLCPQTFIFQLETLPSCPLFMRNPINYESNHVLFNLTNPILHVKWALRLCFRDQKTYISGKDALLFLDGHKATSTWRCSNYYYFDNLIVKMEVLNLGPKGATLGATHLKLNAKKAVPSNGTVASRWRNLIIRKNIHFHQNKSIYIYIPLLKFHFW